MTYDSQVEPGCRQEAGLVASDVPAQGGASTAFPEATEAALEILRAGGNAVDAAVAAAWALSVCEPSASGLGGQTTLLVYQPGDTVRIIDGHSYAPASASLATVSPGQQRVGHRACTIPSTPATLAYAQRQHGRLPPSHVLAPAIRLAEEGYAITSLQQRQAGWVVGHLRASSTMSRFFLTNGQPRPPGYMFRQPQLAVTLRRMADQGVDDFYRGAIAWEIAEDMRRHGGLMTRKDLNTCTLPVEREPLCVSYRGLRVVSTPPPGGGLQLLLALKILERLLPADGSFDASAWFEAIALATYGSFREREKSPLGSEDLSPTARRWLLSEERIRQVAAEVRDGKTNNTKKFAGEGPGDTTHLTVADRAGSVVSLTQSIQSVFGAKVAHPLLGFIYNNYLCTCPRWPSPYRLSGNCRPQSNAAPTLVLKDGRSGRSPLLALGAAGSRRITSAILQVISSVVDRGLKADDAVAAPRVHALLSGTVWIEEPAASQELSASLRARFLEVRLKPPQSYKLGSVQALQWLPQGVLLGAADPRRDGAAVTLA
jgi:gamma-glutamyltranspeptidase / glutathione hydrolase